MASRPNKVTLEGVSDVTIPVSRYDEHTTVQIAVTGTATWTLKWSLANVMRGETPQWSDHPAGALTGSAAGQAQFDFPITALQLAITAGTGTVTATIVQSG